MDIKHTLIPLLAAGILSTFFLAGCGKESSAGKDKVRVGYLAEPAHGLHFIAKDLGFFDEENLDVDLFQFNTTAEGCSAVQAQKLDVGTFGTAAPLLFIARGVDFTIFGGMMIGGQAIIVKPENLDKFKDLSNFKGKKVGLGKLSTGDVIFRGALKKAGIDPNKDLEIIEFGGQSAVVEAVNKGAVDAGIVFSPHFSLAKKNFGLEVSNYIADFQPDYTCCRLIANTPDLQKKRDIYRRYLIGEIRAYKFYRENEEETIQIFAKAFKLDPELLKADTYTNKTFTSNPDPLKKGTIDFWETMKEIDYLPENEVHIDDHIDPTIYREALDEVLKRYPDDPIYKEMDAFFKANN